MSAMRHKGQTARIEYSDADGLFVGCLLGIADVVGFHAASGAWLKLCTPPPVWNPETMPIRLQSDWLGLQKLP